MVLNLVKIEYDTQVFQGDDGYSESTCKEMFKVMTDEEVEAFEPAGDEDNFAVICQNLPPLYAMAPKLLKLLKEAKGIVQMVDDVSGGQLDLLSQISATVYNAEKK